MEPINGGLAEELQRPFKCKKLHLFISRQINSAPVPF